MTGSSLLVVALWACATEHKKSSGAVSSESEMSSASEPTPSSPPAAPEVSSTAIGEGDARPSPEATHRSIKRMSIAQLRRSMEAVSGGVEWSTPDESYWDIYGDTLGVADHQTRLRDNLDPSIMFQKFLDDAAVHTCREWLEREAEGWDRRFFTAAEPDEVERDAVRANLVHLRRLMHGRQSTVDDAIITGLENVFDTVLVRTDDPLAAWKTVCVGLFTHPDFYAY